METQQIIQTVKHRYDQRLHKNLLEEKYRNKLLVTAQNGYWLCSTTLIAFLSVESLGSEIYAQDEYKNVLLVNRVELLNSVVANYNQAMTMWAKELEELKTKR